MSDSHRSAYGIQLLDDLHNYFPALLYDDLSSFTSVQDVLAYIRNITAGRYNLFDSLRNEFRNTRVNSSLPRGQPRMDMNFIRPNEIVNRYYPEPLLHRPVPAPAPRPAYDLLLFLSESSLLRRPVYEDVAVHASSDTLELTTTVTTLIGDLDENCSVCQDRMKEGESIRTLECDHRFHSQCVDPWLLTRSTLCPSCRHDIRTDLPGATDGEGSAAPVSISETDAIFRPFLRERSADEQDRTLDLIDRMFSLH